MSRHIFVPKNSVDRPNREGETTAVPELTIEPFEGWRQWEVSPRQPWEGAVDVPVLRGAWARAWSSRSLKARCLLAPFRPTPILRGFQEILEQRETGQHPGPAPDPHCRCGIYALKVGVIPSTPPRLAGSPRVAGFVELTGMVIEGDRGFRAEQATLVGPLDLVVPCGGSSLGDDPCPDPPVRVATVDSAYRGLCPFHLEQLQPQRVTDLPEWRWAISQQIEDTYGVPLIDWEKGGAHGHW